MQYETGVMQYETRSAKNWKIPIRYMAGCFILLHRPSGISTKQLYQ